MSSANNLITKALAIVEGDARVPRSLDVKMLEIDWPSPSAETPAGEQYRVRLSRAHACVAIARDQALQHYPLLDWLPPSPGLRTSLRIAQSLDFHVADPYVYPFDLLVAITREVVHEDPVFRAANFLQSSPEHSQSALCKEAIEQRQAPLNLLVEERRAVIQLDLSRSQDIRYTLTPNDTLARYVRQANAEHAKRNSDAATRESSAAIFRLATAKDAHTEFVPVLTRIVDGRQAQVLRPLSGDATLVLAYSKDCRAGASPGRTVRVHPASYPERTPSSRTRSLSRGPER